MDTAIARIKFPYFIYQTQPDFIRAKYNTSHIWGVCTTLHWRHNERGGVSNHQIVYSTVYSDADQSKHQSSASLAFVRGIHRGPVNSPHKWPVTRKKFPFDDVIMRSRYQIHGQVIGSASGSRDFTRFGPGGSTLSRFPCKTPIGKVGTSQYTFVTMKLA